MAGITGPIRTLPGFRHPVPNGMKCDDHPDRDAIARIQGETDSFGSEMMDLCQECLNEFNKDAADSINESNWCDHCNAMVSEQTLPVRDPDEGSTGPVYNLCSSHRKSLMHYHNRRIHEDVDE